MRTLLFPDTGNNAGGNDLAGPAIAAAVGIWFQETDLK
jgi:hypothetical protein